MVKLKSLTGARLKIVSIGADKVTAIIIYRLFTGCFNFRAMWFLMQPFIFVEIYILR